MSYLNFNGSINDWAYFLRLLSARLPEHSQIVEKYTFKRFLHATIQLPGERYDFLHFRFNRRKYQMQEQVPSMIWK